jgi:hypothetical protein
MNSLFADPQHAMRERTKILRSLETEIADIKAEAIARGIDWPLVVVLDLEDEVAMRTHRAIRQLPSMRSEGEPPEGYKGIVLAALPCDRDTEAVLPDGVYDMAMKRRPLMEPLVFIGTGGGSVTSFGGRFA